MHPLNEAHNKVLFYLWRRQYFKALENLIFTVQVMAITCM